MSGGKGWKRDRSAVFVPPDAPTFSGNVAGRPRGGGQGPSRATQQAGTTAATAARLAAAAREAAETEAAAAGANDEAGADDEGDLSTWGLRAEKQDSAWKDICSAHRALYYDCLPCNLARSKEEADGMQRSRQSEVEEWQPSACQCGCDAASFSRHPAGDVWYYGRTCVFQLSLYEWQCSSCNRRVAPSPLAFGCLPSTPTIPQMWFELQLLQLYRRLGHEGLSSTCWLSCLLPLSLTL